MEEQLRDLFQQSLDLLVRSELENILAGVNERNLCGRLAIHMSGLLPYYSLNEYFVDPEYNRKQNGRIKTILDENFEVVTINCDLILHGRGRAIEGDNLVAIEMKKSNRPKEAKENDRKRLRALTKSSFDDVWSADGEVHPEHVCNYKFGFYIEVDIASRTFLVEEYAQGGIQNEYKRQF